MSTEDVLLDLLKAVGLLILAALLIQTAAS